MSRALRRNQILAAAVVTAALLAALAAVALSRTVANEEYERTDARLSAELAGAVRALDDLARDARDRAVRLAAGPRVQAALASGDTATLDRIGTGVPDVRFEVDGMRIAGAEREFPLGVSAAVVSAGRQIGRVVVDVPVAAVEQRTALAAGDRLVAGQGEP